MSAWLIFYEDADIKPEVFAGAGAEDAALARFASISTNWNAHLFKCVQSNVHDSPFVEPHTQESK